MDEILKLLKSGLDGGLAVVILVLVVACLYMLWDKVVRPAMDKQIEIIEALGKAGEQAHAAANSSERCAEHAKEACASAEQAAEKSKALAQVLERETVRLGAVCRN